MKSPWNLESTRTSTHTVVVVNQLFYISILLPGWRLNSGIDLFCDECSIYF